MYLDSGGTLRISIQLYFIAVRIGVLVWGLPFSCLICSLSCLDSSLWHITVFTDFGIIHSLEDQVLPCKSVFENENSLLSAFCSLWQCTIRSWLYALLMTDAQALDPLAYSEFNSVLVSLGKRL